MSSISVYVVSKVAELGLEKHYFYLYPPQKAFLCREGGGQAQVGKNTPNFGNLIFQAFFPCLTKTKTKTNTTMNTKTRLQEDQILLLFSFKVPLFPISPSWPIWLVGYLPN